MYGRMHLATRVIIATVVATSNCTLIAQRLRGVVTTTCSAIYFLYTPQKLTLTLELMDDVSDTQRAWNQLPNTGFRTKLGRVWIRRVLLPSPLWWWCNCVLKPVTTMWTWNQLPPHEHGTSCHNVNMEPVAITWTWNQLPQSEHETSCHNVNMKPVATTSTWNQLPQREHGTSCHNVYMEPVVTTWTWNQLWQRQHETSCTTWTWNQLQQREHFIMHFLQQQCCCWRHVTDTMKFIETVHRYIICMFMMLDRHSVTGACSEVFVNHLHQNFCVVFTSSWVIAMAHS